MKQLRCPICHSWLTIEQIIQDEMGRELMTLLLRQKPTLQGPLSSYLGLFRAVKKRDLAYDRALKLAVEVLGLAEPDTLASALSQVVEAMRQKQQEQGENWKPLSNHNYLKRVIEGVASECLVPVKRIVSEQPPKPRQLTKTAQGLASLDALSNQYTE